MSPHLPDPWVALVLALAAFRLTRLVGWDDISARARGWLGVTDAEYAGRIEFIEIVEQKGDDPWDDRWSVDGRPLESGKLAWYIARLIRCPWCAGFWVSGLVAVAWCAYADEWVGLPLVWLGLSAAVGLTAKWLDP